MVKADGNILVIGNRRIELAYSIQKIIEFSTQIIVLIYDDIIIPNNVISYDKNGNKIWVINDILNIKRPTGNVNIEVTEEGYLDVYSSLNMIFRIDIEKRKLVEKVYLR